MADTYTVFVLRNGELVETTGTTPTTVGPGGTVDWGAIQNKPTEYPPSLHSHQVGDVSGLQDTLDVLTAGVSSWDNIVGHPVTGVVEVFCTGDVMLPRPIVPAGYRVRYMKATLPTFGGIYMQPRDSWCRWNG